ENSTSARQVSNSSGRARNRSAPVLCVGLPAVLLHKQRQCYLNRWQQSGTRRSLIRWPKASWDQGAVRSGAHGRSARRQVSRVERVRKAGVFSYTPPCILYTPLGRKRFLDVFNLFR